MTGHNARSEEGIAALAERLSRALKRDPDALGKKLADDIIENNEHFRKARDRVNAELARGGRTANKRFRL